MDGNSCNARKHIKVKYHREGNCIHLIVIEGTEI